ncbi:hypothetical protein MK489_17310 [Myxococcota bacterium]|nr:hypothetical protein [Myxococcota bacterium]
MKQKLLILVSMLVAFGLAGQAFAGTSYYAGTLKVAIGDSPPALVKGSGVATFNGGAGGTHVTTLTYGGELDGVTTVPITDPIGIADNGIISIRLSIDSDSGTLKKILPGSSASTVTALTDNQIGASGLVRLCLFFPGCGVNLPLELGGVSNHTSGSNNVPAGAGIGGFATIGGSGVIRISVDYRPWTVLTGSMIDQPDDPTASGTISYSGVTAGEHLTNSDIATNGFRNRTVQGVVHGPASNASTVALGNPSVGGFGVLQFVSPTQTESNLSATSSLRTASPSTLTMRVVPEPGMLILLVSGVVGLGVLGHRRMKK